MPEPFVQHYSARWSDMDFNQHMRNAAFLGCAEETRMRYLDANGWTMAEFMKRRIGPVVLEDTLQYRKELKLLERFRVEQELAGITADGSRMRVRNCFYREGDGALCAIVESVILWLDLDLRKPVTPPEALRDLWLALPHTDDFQEMTRESKS